MVQYQVTLMVEQVVLHLFQLVVKLQLLLMEEVVVENMEHQQTQELMVLVVVQDIRQEQDKVQMEHQDKDLMVETQQEILTNKVAVVVEQVEMEQMAELAQTFMEV